MSPAYCVVPLDRYATSIVAGSVADQSSPAAASPQEPVQLKVPRAPAPAASRSQLQVLLAKRLQDLHMPGAQAEAQDQPVLRPIVPKAAGDGSKRRRRNHKGGQGQDRVAKAPLA
jgi:hypothetical protein